MNVLVWHRTAEQTTHPTVVCGNNCEMKGRKIKKNPSFAKKKSCKYYEISTNCKYNLEEPFLYLAQKLSGDNDLRFISVQQSLVELCRVSVVENVLIKGKEENDHGTIIDTMIQSYYHSELDILEACIRSIKENKLYMDCKFVHALAEACKDHDAPDLWNLLMTEVLDDTEKKLLKDANEGRADGIQEEIC